MVSLGFGCADAISIAPISVSDNNGHVSVSWHKVKKATKYQVVINGKTVARTKKRSYTATLAPGTYEIKVRGYHLKKQKRYYNRRTKKWQKKRPKGRVKVRRVKVPKYSKYIRQTITVKAPGKAPVNIREAFMRQLIEENRLPEYSKASFTWDTEGHGNSWAYFNGLMFDGLYQNGHAELIESFYSDNILSDGTVKRYRCGELDSVACAKPIFYILDKSDKYPKAIQYVYSDLEKQLPIEGCGGNVYHKQNPDGTPKGQWAKYPLALDGLYMSLPFMAECANAIDDGRITLYHADGSEVTSKELYETIHQRIMYVSENMYRVNGLYSHGRNAEYSNEHSWSRAEGWYCMCLVDVYEKFPPGSMKNDLKGCIEKALNGLIRYQDRSGLWYNVLDRDASLKNNRLEISGTAMFGYSYLKAAKMGINPSLYTSVGRKAATGIEQRIYTVNGKYRLDDIYKVSGVYDSDEEYCRGQYSVNEAKGLGAVLLMWAMD